MTVNYWHSLQLSINYNLFTKWQSVFYNSILIKLNLPDSYHSVILLKCHACLLFCLVKQMLLCHLSRMRLTLFNFFLIVKKSSRPEPKIHKYFSQVCGSPVDPNPHRRKSLKTRLEHVVYLKGKVE